MSKLDTLYWLDPEQNPCQMNTHTHTHTKLHEWIIFYYVALKLTNCYRILLDWKNFTMSTEKKYSNLSKKPSAKYKPKIKKTNRQWQQYFINGKVDSV